LAAEFKRRQPGWRTQRIIGMGRGALRFKFLYCLTAKTKDASPTQSSEEQTRAIGSSSPEEGRGMSNRWRRLGARRGRRPASPERQACFVWIPRIPSRSWNWRVVCFGDLTRWSSEYTFGVRVCDSELRTSAEHTEFEWVDYETCRSMLHWHSNRNALVELNHRIMHGLTPDSATSP